MPMRTLTLEVSEAVYRWLEDRLEKQSAQKINAETVAHEAFLTLDEQRRREGYRLACESDAEYFSPLTRGADKHVYS